MQKYLNVIHIFNNMKTKEQITVKQTGQAMQQKDRQPKFQTIWHCYAWKHSKI